MEISPLEEIKNRLDVVEVIGSYIKLEKTGRNYRARCPFHSERTPSFMVSQERQIWHCFGCGLGGDIFAFVKQIEGVEFGDALRILASRAGVVLKRQDPAINTQRKRLYEICELATKFFEKQLESSKSGVLTQKYLTKERGLKPQTINQWRLGWAPDDWQALSDFLKSKNYKDKEIFDAGLASKSEKNADKLYDRFRSRIMFPLFDIQGQIVGFAGRIFGKEDPNAGKYINTPQTILYDKSRLLYGLNFAKQELRQKNSAIFVEGNLDVIMSHQAGQKNAIATSGTALTTEHLKIIRRYTDNLLFAFDTDEAGQIATRRSIDLALENDFGIKVIPISQKDPADLIKQNPASWQKAVDNSVSIIEYYFSNTFSKYPSILTGKVNPEEKKQIAKILLPVIKKLANKIEQADWIAELAKKIKVSEKIIYEVLQKVKDNSSNPSEKETTKIQPQIKSRAQELQERLLGLLLNFPENISSLSQSKKKIFFDAKLAKIFNELCSASENSLEKEKCLRVLKKKLPEDINNDVDLLCLDIDRLPTEADSAALEIQNCSRELNLIRLKDAMTELAFEIQEAQEQHTSQKLQKAIKKFKELSQELTELTNNI